MKRRDFLEKTILGAAAIVAAPTMAPEAAPALLSSGEVVLQMAELPLQWAYMIDVTLCGKGVCDSFGLHAPGDREIVISEIKVNGELVGQFPVRLAPGKHHTLRIENPTSETKSYHVFARWS